MNGGVSRSCWLLGDEGGVVLGVTGKEDHLAGGMKEEGCCRVVLVGSRAVATKKKLVRPKYEGCERRTTVSLAKPDKRCTARTFSSWGSGGGGL